MSVKMNLIRIIQLVNYYHYGLCRFKKCCHTLSHNALGFTLSLCPVIGVIAEDFCDFFFIGLTLKRFNTKLE